MEFSFVTRNFLSCLNYFNRIGIFCFVCTHLYASTRPEVNSRVSTGYRCVLGSEGTAPLPTAGFTISITTRYGGGGHATRYRASFALADRLRPLAWQLRAIFLLVFSRVSSLFISILFTRCTYLCKIFPIRTQSSHKL